MTLGSVSSIIDCIYYVDCTMCASPISVLFSDSFASLVHGEDRESPVYLFEAVLM